MANDILLTVGIPTFNGERFLADAIQSALSQREAMATRGLEILVSDNASSDRTGDLVRHLQESYPGLISYYRNQENVGFDRNIDLIFKRAKGQLIWLLSDDDALNAGALEKLTQVIDRRAALSVIFSNYSAYRVDLHSPAFNPRESLAHDVFCRSGDDFFIASRFLIGLVSSMIIRRSDWNALNVEDFCGTGWAFIEAVSMILAKNGTTSYIIADPLVRLRTESSRWGEEGKFLLQGLKIVKIMQKMPALGYSGRTTDYLVSCMKRSNLRAILRANRSGLSNKRDVAPEMIACYGRYVSLWAIDLPILFTPNALWKAVYKFYSWWSRPLNDRK